MSQENLENARRVIDAWNRGDLAEWLAGFAPEVELHTTGRFPDQAIYRGRAGLERYWAEIRGDVEELSLSLSDMRAIGDRVFFATTGKGRGTRERATEVAVQQHQRDPRQHGAHPATARKGARPCGGPGVAQRSFVLGGVGRADDLTTNSPVQVPPDRMGGYCVGDVAGERRGRAPLLRGVERRWA
jgi:ketosteroid isomerase-like protein